MMKKCFLCVTFCLVLTQTALIGAATMPNQKLNVSTRNLLLILEQKFERLLQKDSQAQLDLLTEELHEKKRLFETLYSQEPEGERRACLRSELDKVYAKIQECSQDPKDFLQKSITEIMGILSKQIPPTNMAFKITKKDLREVLERRLGRLLQMDSAALSAHIQKELEEDIESVQSDIQQLQDIQQLLQAGYRSKQMQLGFELYKLQEKLSTAQAKLESFYRNKEAFNEEYIQTLMQEIEELMQ